mmetsp:Transcript_21858/g.35398  ORF Transcript_21858/g.35398 Transcript_21858/m.35398 type:complete len:287 (+) Transcript_21858:6436-7296(+)
MQLDGSLCDPRRVLGDVRVETSKVPLDDLRKHGADHVLAGHLHGEGDEVTLHARGDVERPRGGVHARHVLTVLHLLKHDLSFVIPPVVVNVLPRQLDGRLGVVLVHKGHVHVVEEVYQALGAGGTEAHAALLLQRLLDDDLQRRRVHEVVHVHRREGPILRVEVLQVFAHERRLAGPRVAHKHAVVLVGDERVKEVRQARGLHRGDEYVGEGVAGVVPEPFHLVVPRNHRALVVDVVVEHQPRLGEQHGLPLRCPPLAKLSAEVDHLVHHHRTAQRPHRGEHEVVL